MKLTEIIEKLHLDVRVGNNNLDKDVNRGYASDLLSDVLGNSEEGDLWITLQIHPNTVAIASMKGLAAIALINSREPEEETIAKANEENMPILLTDMTAFELCGRLYAMGISGTKTDEGI
jgi:hypothetical protein